MSNALSVAKAPTVPALDLRSGTRERPLHFSDLKRMSESALDFAHFAAHPPKRTGSQAIGALVHEEILGPRPGAEILRFPGESRRGKAWEAFAACNPGREIATMSEVDDAVPIVEAVRYSELCRPWLIGKTEVPLSCELVPGVWIETRGVDVVGDVFVTELKTTANPKPARFIYDFRKYHYNAQLALYRAMAARVGMARPDARAIVVLAGTSEPWHCYPIEVTERWLEIGSALISTWVERFRACRDEGRWPGYVQSLYQLPDPYESGTEVESE